MIKSDIYPVEIDGERFYKISNMDYIRPFFMSIVSDSNHWMFISSNGGLTAGRKNSDYSLFPYYTDDKITESAEWTGSKSIFWVTKGSHDHLWEPFSIRQEGVYSVTRNIYKNKYGNKVIFEEINQDLNLTYRYQWNSSNIFGFIKKSEIINVSDDGVEVLLLDGLQNILPAGVGSDLQNQSSNLVDAYKRSELIKDVGLGIFALSAIIVDKAEPSEALKANVVWSIGLDQPTYLLSSLQLSNFRKKIELKEEMDVKAEKGAYFVSDRMKLASQESKEWMIVSDVNKNHSDVIALAQQIKTDRSLKARINETIKTGTQELIKLVAASDGLQKTADHLRDTRHYSNTLFNIMRGGIFDNNYSIDKSDFVTYLAKANKNVYEKFSVIIDELPDNYSTTVLLDKAKKSENSDFLRLCIEYLPLKFSRRHGDPSRPWNKFSINTQSEIDGSKILDYEGNWRDIFQNWEALALSYPGFIDGMIHKFLNASTFDGYNPYRVTKDGFDWEKIEADNPWSYIGYWGDHQIIYLLKFLEFIERSTPGKLEEYFDKDLFVYANVPYKIKNYSDLLDNPKDTIEFDEQLDRIIHKRKMELGADGALLLDENGSVHGVNFIEKILATVLAKLSNFIPEGGIWMNTQRPEWNDANNALVGNGVSMVTLYYLRRFLTFFKDILASSDLEGVKVSSELMDFYKRIRKVLEDHQELLTGSIGDKARKQIVDGLGMAGSDYRQHIYNQSFWGRKRTISFSGLRHFVDLSILYMEHSIRVNRRQDHLYHAYNLITIKNDKEISVSHLSEMLEGQVGALSSGYLPGKDCLNILNGLKKSSLFRDDQYSYILYPNKELLGFLGKNLIPEEAVTSSIFLTEQVKNNRVSIIEKDILGNYHFNSDFKNANDLKAALDDLDQSSHDPIPEEDQAYVLDLFEKVFNHKEFTGRSGTFYGYEGLGSIYWHMVSKLQLAVQECCLKAIKDKEDETIIGGLLEHYYEINEGIGVHKSPSLYGGFPTDPYSHTPGGKGAQQPGMTGQVKEDILSRFGELGAFVEGGKLYFDPCMLRKDEFIAESIIFHYVDVHGDERDIQLAPESLGFTYCQVPVIYKIGMQNTIEFMDKNGESTTINSLKFDRDISQLIFNRTGDISQIMVQLVKSDLR